MRNVSSVLPPTKAKRFSRDRQEDRGVQEREPGYVQLGDQGQVTEGRGLRQEQRSLRWAQV